MLLAACCSWYRWLAAPLTRSPLRLPLCFIRGDYDPTRKQRDEADVEASADEKRKEERKKKKKEKKDKEAAAEAAEEEPPAEDGEKQHVCVCVCVCVRRCGCVRRQMHL